MGRRIAPAVAALTLIASGIAAAATTESVEFQGRFAKSARSKQRGGLALRTIINISDPAAKAPLRLSRTVLRFPKGGFVNGRYFPQCKAAVLRARGPLACPKGSLLGSGRARGAAPPFVDVVNAKVKLFNGRPKGRNPTILINSVPDIGPVLVFEGVIKRVSGPHYGYVLDVEVPPIPTLPNQPNAAVTFFDATTRDLTVRRKGRTIHYIDSPVVCDGTYFLLDGALSYQGGVVNTVFEAFTLRGGPRCP